MNKSTQRHTSSLLAKALIALLLLSFNVNAQNRVTIQLSNADINDLIAWARDLTNKTIITHPQVSGRVSVTSREPMLPDEAYRVFLSTLEVSGFRVVESEESIKILPAAQSLQAQPISSTKAAANDRINIEVLRLEHADATSIASLLKPLASHVSIIAAYKDNNMLLLADTQGNLDKITELAKSFDTPSENTIHQYTLKYIAANEVSDTIARIIGDQSGASTKTQLIADSRSNSIFVSGTQAIQVEISQLIDKLDTPQKDQGSTQVIFLNYAVAKDLIPILQNIAANEPSTTEQPPKIGLQADSANNALIITAPLNIQNSLQRVISKLDIRKSQVLVEAIIAEVNLDTSNAIGIEWKTPSEGKKVFGGFSNFPASTSPVTLNNGKLSLGSGLSISVLENMEFSALISLLQGQAETNILSTPTLMALDNEEAHILVGENVPFVVGSKLAAGDETPFQTIQRQDIGISLKLKPQINQHGSVALEIEQKVESISAAEIEASDIITNKREIKTRVLVDNQQTLVLGGLMRDEIQISETRVPLLSSIPIIGRAFRSTSQKSVKRNLLVFLRPTILEDSLSNTTLSKEKYDIIREAQIRFNNIKDRPSYPPKLTAPELPELAP